MNQILGEITQISIYLKEKAERINEVALFQPFVRNTEFNLESKPIAARRWRYTSNIPFFRRLSLKFQSFLFKYCPLLIPSERLTPEAKFKTVLAILLAQEEVRDFFLSDAQRRENFYRALSDAAYAIGYHQFSPPPASYSENFPIQISRSLTKLEGKEKSLIDDLIELNLQMAALSHPERSEILYRILNRIERPPITSVVEIIGPTATKSIPLTTQYAKYKIKEFNEIGGQITYSYAENQATSSIRTQKNVLPNAKGAMNQRIVFDSDNQTWIGSYCGHLSSSFHVLEQILWILKQKKGSAQVIKQPPKGAVLYETKILFISLYSWHEIQLITDQRSAIRKWDQQILWLDGVYTKLNLLYANIPFNALNNYPAPAEISAKLRDINDEALISLAADAWHMMGISNEGLSALASRVLTLRELGHTTFLEKEKALLEEIDHFRELKQDLLATLETLPANPFHLSLKGLLSDKKPNGKALKGIDKLMFLTHLAGELGYLHNKNCENATDRSAGADAADKAQYAYKKIYKNVFLPGYDSEHEQALFKVLYSMYLVWEEPEINTWLSTGFVGEKFYNNFIQKNPETTRYLVRWLKKHPEVYLGCSHYRK
jgi:hypothetical protein